MNRINAALVALALAPGLSGCAVPGDEYPSLAIRPVERIVGSGTPAEAEPAPPPAPPPSAQLEGRIAQLLAAGRTAHAAFAQRRPAVSGAVGAASGASRSSDAWAAAAVALGTLQSLRSGTMTALADLDELYARERLANSDVETPSALAVGEARSRVEAWANEEDAAVAALAARLGI